MTGRREIMATPIIMRSETAECVCCDGKHIFARGVRLDDFAYRFMSQGKPTVNDWINQVVDLAQCEGRRLKITVEILSDGQSTGGAK